MVDRGADCDRRFFPFGRTDRTPQSSLPVDQCSCCHQLREARRPTQPEGCGECDWRDVCWVALPSAIDSNNGLRDRCWFDLPRPGPFPDEGLCTSWQPASWLRSPGPSHSGLGEMPPWCQPGPGPAKRGHRTPSTNRSFATDCDRPRDAPLV